MATANNEFFEALAALEKERGLPADYLIEKIKAAIVIAVKKDYEVEDDNVVVDIDPELGAFRASLLRDIVEEVENPHTQVSLEDAQKIRKSYKVGQRMVTPLKTKEFGRIAAQTAKHVIRQGLREGERNLQCSEMQSRAHELIAATVVSIDPERGNIVLDLGKGGSAVLPRNEQVPGETFTEGQTVQVYVVDVLATDRGPRVTISRTHPGLVKRMFELEVPEIYDGTVEVKAIAREAGARTKLAVWSKNPDVDPVGACIGARGARVEKIVQELNGEKIDVIRWSEDITEFISRGIVDDQVHTGGGFQRTDVATLAADDAALHLVTGQRHHAHGGLAAVVGGAAAHGLTDQVAGDVVAVLLQVGLVGGNAHGLFVGELLIHLVQQHLAGVLLAQAGQRFQTLHLLSAQGVDLGQTGVGLGGTLLQVLFLALQGFGLAVQGIFLLVNAVFLTADLSTALFDLLVGLCLLGIDLGLQLEGLVLGFQNRFLALLVCGLDRFVHQAGRLGFGAADLCFGGLFPVVITNKIARSCTDNTHDQGHDHFDRGHRVHSPLF